MNLMTYDPMALCVEDDRRDMHTAEHTANLGIEGLQYHPDRRVIDYAEIARYLTHGH